MSIAYSCSPDSPKISFVNGAWVDRRFPLSPSPQQCLRDTFKSEAKIHDFAYQADEAVRDINSWAELQTNGLIKEVIGLEQIKPLTAVILANALYFKGFWLYKFDTQRTRKRDFYLLNGDKISDISFMAASRFLLYGSCSDFEVVEIPYQTGKKNGDDEQQFSMQIILPRQRDGLQNLLEKLNADSGRWNFELGFTKLDVFLMPKFKFYYTLDNIRFPFMDEQMELTEMLLRQQTDYEREAPFISQKAFIEVDEEGTEAAAVTYRNYRGCALRQEQPKIRSFVADHPLMFTIKENISGLVLFTGAILNPKIH